MSKKQDFTNYNSANYKLVADKSGEPLWNITRQIFVAHFYEDDPIWPDDPLTKTIVFMLNGLVPKRGFNKRKFLEELTREINKQGYKYYYNDDSDQELSWIDSIEQAAIDVVNEYNNKNHHVRGSTLTILSDACIEKIQVFCSC